MPKNNIYLAYILTFLSECYWPSVAALFFYLRYFSFAEIATLWAIQMAASNLFEIPTGAFADIVGRKTSVILSFVIGAISLLIFPFTTAFPVFVGLEILKGLANALYSGSMEALVYDSLKESGEEKNYPKISATSWPFPDFAFYSNSMERGISTLYPTTSTSVYCYRTQ